MGTAWIFALLISAQAPSESLEGTVLGADGKPAAGVEVFLSSGMAIDGSQPARASGKTAADGRFRLEFPTVARPESNWAWSVWAYQDGEPPRIGLVRASRAEDRSWNEARIALFEPRDRQITLIDGDGKPMEGVRVIPHSILRQRSWNGYVTPPDPLAERLAATTDASGSANWRSFAADDRLIGARIRSPRTGDQVISMARFEDGPAESFRIELPRPGSAAWKISMPDGSPAPGLAVEVWSRNDNLGPNRVRFDGEGQTDGQGIFRTGSTLFEGVSYRAVVRAEGMDFLLTPWSPASPEPIACALRPLRSVPGRVVDRQGKSVSGALVFQKASGPKPTESGTDVEGRFELKGVAPGAGHLFVQADGFRFQGLRFDGPGPAIVTLTRTDEPAEPMTTLPDVLPEAERKAIARRILMPYLERVLPSKEEGAKFWCFASLMAIDPAEALERVETTPFEHEQTKSTVLNYLAREFGREDPAEGIALLESIRDPGERADAIVDLVDALPQLPAETRREWLSNAAISARATTSIEQRILHLGNIADLLWDLGDRDQARALLEEGRALAEKVADPQSPYRGIFASRLARIDLPAAIRILEGLEDRDRKDECLRSTAIRVADSDPDAAESLIHRLAPVERFGALERLCERLVKSDRRRAERLVTSQDHTLDQVTAWLLMSRALLHDDPEASRAYAHRAIKPLARMARDSGTDSADAVPWINASFLPFVEAVDPQLVREAFWLAISARSIQADPRRDTGSSTNETLALLLSRYDRQVAEDLLGPSLAAFGDPKPGALLSVTAVETLAAIDPRRAEAYIARLPEEPNLYINQPINLLRTRVSEMVAGPVELRWHRIWRMQSSLGGLMSGRDVW
ncbi:MAG: hypothetical protein U0800_06580 [Isosphaeraceae bacterium]